jgi:hypothetical protein
MSTTARYTESKFSILTKEKLSWTILMFSYASNFFEIINSKKREKLRSIRRNTEAE